MPEKLEDWNLQVLENLLKIKDIENESFDFKREIESKNKLNEDVCAMANTSGGYLVLGIEENKAPNGYLLGFKKHGFKQGMEDSINLSITNSVHNVDTLPKISIKQIPGSGEFYVIIKKLVMSVL